jgi:hypothetical protein
MTGISVWTARGGLLVLAVLLVLVICGSIALAQDSMDDRDEDESIDSTVIPVSSAGAESQVQVTTDRPRYGRREPIVVTVTSSAPNPIFTLTGRTYCTDIAVQRRESNEWRSVGPCVSAEPRLFRPVQPKGTMVITLDPEARNSLVQPFDPGTYRIELPYATQVPPIQWLTVYSPDFEVADP